MFITSEELINDLTLTAKRVEIEFDGLLKFDEYIAVPCYGSNIILRFSYTGNEPVSLAKLDELEVNLRKAIGSKYLANLMGAIYQKQGLNYGNLKITARKIDALFDIDICSNAFYKKRLENDCANIKTLFNLQEDMRIWEIQINAEELLILVLHNGGTAIQDNTIEVTVAGDRKMKLVFLEDDNSYHGLMKAFMLAVSQKVSLCHILLDYQD